MGRPALKPSSRFPRLRLAVSLGNRWGLNHVKFGGLPLILRSSLSALSVVLVCRPLSLASPAWRSLSPPLRLLALCSRLVVSLVACLLVVRSAPRLFCPLLLPGVAWPRARVACGRSATRDSIASTRTLGRVCEAFTQQQVYEGGVSRSVADGRGGI